MSEKMEVLIVDTDKQEITKIIKICEELSIASIHVATTLVRAKEQYKRVIEKNIIVILDGQFPVSSEASILDLARYPYSGSKGMINFLKSDILHSTSNILLLSNSTNVEHNHRMLKETEEYDNSQLTCIPTHKERDEIQNAIQSFGNIFGSEKTA